MQFGQKFQRSVLTSGKYGSKTLKNIINDWNLTKQKRLLFSDRNFNTKANVPASGFLKEQSSAKSVPRHGTYFARRRPFLFFRRWRVKLAFEWWVVEERSKNVAGSAGRSLTEDLSWELEAEAGETIGPTSPLELWPRNADNSSFVAGGDVNKGGDVSIVTADFYRSLFPNEAFHAPMTSRPERL